MSAISYATLCQLALAGCAHASSGNHAININGFTQNNKHADIHITHWGSDWYFAIMSVMGVTVIGILAAAYRKPISDRIIFYICAAICVVATLSYFAMGSNLGWTPIDVEWQRPFDGLSGRNHEVFYARYIDWFITTSLIILSLLLTAGLPWPTILWTIFLDWVMVIMGLVGALVRTRYK